MDKILKVRINSPEKVVWEGEALWVSSVNTKGPFDILPLHANFITIIQKQTIRIKLASGEVQEYAFPNGVIYTHSNRVFIYTGL